MFIGSGDRAKEQSLVFSFICFASSQQGFCSSDVEVFAVGANTSFKAALQPLKFAEADAERFVEAMKTVGLVPQLRASALTNPSVAEFRNAMKVLIDEQLLIRPGDVDLQSRKFIFFFSGHSDDRGLHLKDGLISKDELHESLSAVKAHTKIAILDSCFSGAISAKGIEAAPEFELPKVEFDEPSGSVFLSASTGRQLAYESDALEGSIFTHHLLRGLYGDADGNGDGVVTVDELYQYVYQNTKWQSLNYPTRSMQEPEYVAELQGQGAIVLSFPAKTNSRLQLDKALTGEITIAALKGLQFFKIEKSPGQPKTVQLPVGNYKLSLRDGNRVGEGTIKIEPLKLASLGMGDFSWRQADVGMKKAAKGGEESSRAWSYGAMLGSHSSYLAEGSYGPFVEFNFKRRFARTDRFDFHWGGAADYHRHTKDLHDGGKQSITTESLELYGVLSTKYRSSDRPDGFFFGPQLGYGQTAHYQTYSFEKGSEHGLAPGYFYGVELGFGPEFARSFSLVIREEVVDATKISNDPEVHGKMLALQVSL